MKRRLLWIFLIIPILFSCVVDNNNDINSISWIYSDGRYNDIKDVLELDSNEFTKEEDNYLSLGYLDDPVWVKLELKNKVFDQKFLSVPNPMLNTVELYDENGEFINQVGRLNFSNDSYTTFFNIVDVSNFDSNIFYLKISGFGNINVPIEILSDKDEFLTIDERNLFFGIYFGVVFAMFFYNLFLWVSTKDNLYGLYISYIFFVGMTQGILGGYIDTYLWPNSVFMRNYSFYISTSLVNIVGIYYSLKFLKIKEFNKKIFNVGRIVITIYFFILFSFLFDLGIGQLKFRFLQVFLGIVPLFLLGISFYSLKKGYRPAKFFLLSWFLLICSMVIFLLTDLNILPHIFVTNYVL